MRKIALGALGLGGLGPGWPWACVALGLCGLGPVWPWARVALDQGALDDSGLDDTYVNRHKEWTFARLKVFFLKMLFSVFSIWQGWENYTVVPGNPGPDQKASTHYLVQYSSTVVLYQVT